MRKWKIYTPEGVQDILFDECFLKKNLEKKARELFRSRGYLEIETPTLEFYDVFTAEADVTPQETMFKFFDQQGRILVLRPDMTIPAARLCATKLKDMKYPVRLSYIGNAFKYNELGGGKQKEFTQAGVEIMGVDGPEADAEVIATAISTVKAAGIENFQIDIGQVEFFKGLMEETGLSDEHTEQMRALIDSKDFLGIEEMVNKQDIDSSLKELILSLPGLFGTNEIIDRVKYITHNTRSLNGLDNLEKIIGILDDYGFSKYVSVDLGMVQSLNYYTGAIFRGFTYGVGFPVLSGGRYDSLVGKFGEKCPATGFSMGINMIMMALERQKVLIEKPCVDSLICYNEKGRKTAFEICETLRNQGMAIEIDILKQGLEDARDLAESKGLGGIIYVRDKDIIEVHNIETGEVNITSINVLIEKNKL